MRQDRHEGAGLFMFINDVMNFSVDPAVDRMHQTIALPTAWMLKKGRGEDSLAFRRESDVHRIVHPARHHCFDNSALRTAAKNMRRARLEGRSIRTVVGLFCERSFAPVDPSIETQVRPM